MFSPLTLLGFFDYFVIGVALGLGLAIANGLVAIIKYVIGAARIPPP